MNNKKRPVNLNILTIRLPIPAIVSILHRISGLVLFILIPVALWGLSYSLSSQDNFQDLHDKLTTPFMKCVVLLMLAPFIYHFVAGIRHVLLDFNVGVSLQGGRFSSILTLAISFILFILAGVYLW